MKNNASGIRRTKNGMTRRDALKSVGVMGAVPLITGRANRAGVSPQGPGRDSGRRALGEPVLHGMTSGNMTVEFDKQTGTIHSIRAAGGPNDVNFLGNRRNVKGRALEDQHWTGDVVAAAWHLNTGDWIREMSDDPTAVYPRSGQWRVESTLESDDNRVISCETNGFYVGYKEPSRRSEGIRSFRLDMRYRFDGGGALIWDIEIENLTGNTLEIGELALPFRANDDYAGPYNGLIPRQATAMGKMTAIQKTIHEQKVLAHSFIAGHSSYVLAQRPRGDGPFLMFLCEGDSSFECGYKAEGSFGGNWIGTDLLAIHSWATYQRRGWSWNPWINGHSSLVLEPGGKRAFRFRFAFIENYPAVRERLFESGNLGIRVLPSMVVQENSDVFVEIKSRSGLDKIEIHSDGAMVKHRKRTGSATLLTLAFEGRGQKSLKLVYGGGRWTWLHFFCVEDARSLIKARARFMAERQYYENPEDPFNRNHLFLPFDDRLGRRIDDCQDVWEVGGTGDPGLGDPLFLAEKNVHFPDLDEIGKLESYIDDCLFRHIQNPETFEVRDSLYWKIRTPSSPSSSFSKKRSEATWRTYNYTFVANIYHALYRIGKRYGLLRKRTSGQYLRMCYRTCCKWLTTGPFKHVGLITGSNAVEILEDLTLEGWAEEAAALRGLMRTCNEEFLRDPYPYSSEIEIDETGQHQVYFFTRFFAGQGSRESEAKNAEVVRALKALRGGDQPVWFNYGNDLFAHPDLRGQLSCWHSEALNGLCLLNEFESTGDPVALMKGFPGVMSVLRNVRPDGMGFAWFMYSPGVFGFEPPRTFEGGLGLWGFLRAARAYIVDDPAFGPAGYGCRIEKTAEGLRVFPGDGVRKRVRFVAERVAVDVSAGEIENIMLVEGAGSLEIRLDDSTGLVKTARLAVRGLAAGEYEIGFGGDVLRRGVKGPLSLEIPIERAKEIRIRKTAKSGPLPVRRITPAPEIPTGRFP